MLCLKGRIHGECECSGYNKIIHGSWQPKSIHLLQVFGRCSLAIFVPLLIVCPNKTFARYVFTLTCAMVDQFLSSFYDFYAYGGWSCQRVGIMVPLPKSEEFGAFVCFKMALPCFNGEWKGRIRLLRSTSTSSAVFVLLPHRILAQVYINIDIVEQHRKLALSNSLTWNQNYYLYTSLSIQQGMCRMCFVFFSEHVGSGYNTSSEAPCNTCKCSTALNGTTLRKTETSCQPLELIVQSTITARMQTTSKDLHPKSPDL